MPIKYKRTIKTMVHHDGCNDEYFRWKNGSESLEFLYWLDDYSNPTAINDAFEEIVNEFSPAKEYCFMHSVGETSNHYCAIELESNLMVSHSLSIRPSSACLYMNGISLLFTPQSDKEKLKRVKIILKKREKAFRKEFHEAAIELFKETDEIIETDFTG